MSWPFNPVSTDQTGIGGMETIQQFVASLSQPQAQVQPQAPQWPNPQQAQYPQKTWWQALTGSNPQASTAENTMDYFTRLRRAVAAGFGGPSGAATYARENNALDQQNRLAQMRQMQHQNEFGQNVQLRQAEMGQQHFNQMQLEGMKEQGAKPYKEAQISHLNAQTGLAKKQTDLADKTAAWHAENAKTNAGKLVVSQGQLALSQNKFWSEYNLLRPADKIRALSSQIDTLTASRTNLQINRTDPNDAEAQATIRSMSQEITRLQEEQANLMGQKFQTPNLRLMTGEEQQAPAVQQAAPAGSKYQIRVKNPGN
jgi:hypothetical protein